jgi:hypothetical protein
LKKVKTISSENCAYEGKKTICIRSFGRNSDFKIGL